MTLFNFNDDEYEDDDSESYEEIKCQCDECSIEHTLGIVESFTEQILEAKSVEELYAILYQFAEHAKIQGVKEYLFESINITYDTLLGLDIFTKSFLSDNGNDFDNYGNDDIPHWKDRL